jgi:hypothetical protein
MFGHWPAAGDRSVNLLRQLVFLVWRGFYLGKFGPQTKKRFSWLQPNCYEQLQCCEAASLLAVA